MKTLLHPAASRGHANHGWLDSWHSFSFAGYYDPSRIHFGALRVLNDDTVEGGMGFGTHPHDNMEIVSIPLSGDLEHRDSTGRHEVIRQGDVQLMSAGSGIRHSEYNHNRDRAVQFLQIWVFPKLRDIAPRYEQKTFDPGATPNEWVTVVSPEGGDSLRINQDAWFTLGRLEKGRRADYRLHRSGNGVYVFLIDGQVSAGGIDMARRDAAGIWDIEAFGVEALADSELLLIEVPMQF